MAKGDYVDRNFLLVNLNDDKSKKIAEVINNTTARKILDKLSQKDFTETELSTELNIPISTVHYNLKQLVDANLVVVDEFHYSKKGKEINHYKLANKYIIIAPKADSGFMEALKKVFPLFIITACVALIMQLFTNVRSAGTFAMNAAPQAKMMAAESAMMDVASSGTTAATTTQNITAIFLIGAISIIIIYFLYEWVKKK